MSSGTPSRMSSRPTTHSRTPSRVEVVLNGHYISPATHRKGDMPIDPELLAMDIDPALMEPEVPSGVGGGGPGSDEDAEGSDEDAEGEAVDEELEFQPWMAFPPEPTPSHYPASLPSESSRHDTAPSQSEAGPSRLPDLSAVLHGHTADPHQSLSPTSTTTEQRKRGRPPRASTSASLSQPPNGHIVASGHSHPESSLKVKVKINRPAGNKSKGKGRATGGNGIVVPDAYCSFCNLTAERNKRGQPEAMVSCHLCGRSGHFSCLDMTSPELIRTVLSYKWTCIECKTCEVCQAKGNEDELMFCDGCDKGWHFTCTDPPLKRLPKGSWRCNNCKPSTSRAGLPHPTPDAIPKYKGKGKGKGKALEGYTQFHPPLPPSQKPKPGTTGRPRKSGPSHTPAPSDIFDDSLTPKLKPGRRPKINGSTPSRSTPDIHPPPRINIRLRIPARHHSAEAEEPEEEKIPFGGVITGPEADTSKTTILEADKIAFERSRRIAEDKLGGPPPGPSTTSGGGTWETPGQSGGSTYSTPGPSRSQSMSNFTPGRGTPQPPPQPQHSLSRSLRDRLFTQTLPSTPDGHHFSSPTTAIGGSAGTGPSQKINKIRFGAFDIDTWYSAPYPEEYQYVPEGRLWLCEFCLKFMKSGFVAGRHRMKCKARHPPGDEIYRDGNVSVFEVDGRKNKIYCQNLCLLAKMFLDHKTLYYDVEPFLFYVMTEVDDLGARFVGYFSKEKRSPDNNVSCIMTLPVRQRKGWGQLLIDFSYLLSKKEGRVGSPEKPLSGLGAVTYKKYWQLSVFTYLRDKPGTVTLDATSMTLLDVYTTLRDEDLIRVQSLVIPIVRATPSRGRGRGRGRGGASRGRNSLLRHSNSHTDLDDAEPPTPSAPSHPEEPEIKVPELGTYEIVYDRDYIVAVLNKHAAKGHLELRPERLKYHPFLVSRNMPKLGGSALEVATAAMEGEAEGEGDEDSHKTAVEAPNDEADKAIEEVVLHGEDPETLALVAALSKEQSPKRSLRKRTSLSEEAHPGEGMTPRASKRVRRSTRGSPVVVVARRGRSSAMPPPAPTLGSGLGGKGGSKEGAIVIDGDEEEETQVEETHVDEAQVEETQVEETQVEETQVEVEAGQRPGVKDVEEVVEVVEEAEEVVEEVEEDVEEVEGDKDVGAGDVAMTETEAVLPNGTGQADGPVAEVGTIPTVAVADTHVLANTGPGPTGADVMVEEGEDEDAEGEEDEDAEGEADEDYAK